MDVVKKTISLEPYTSRVYGALPFVGYDPANPPASNWGKIVKTVDFSKFTDADVAIYGQNIRLWGKMTYRSIMDTYYTLKARSTEALSSVEPTISNKLEEDKNICLIRFVEKNRLVVGNTNEGKVKCGCPIPAAPEPEYRIDIIPTTPGDQRFLDPELNVSLLLTQKANLIGSYTFLTKDWTAGRKYYIGDTVLYDSQVYVLSTDCFEQVPECYDILDETQTEEVKNRFLPTAKLLYYKVVEENLNTFTDGYSVQGSGITSNSFIEVESVDEIITGGYPFAKIGTVCYIRPFFTGYLDNNTYQIFFDEVGDDGSILVNDDGSTTHWMLRTAPYDTSSPMNVSGKKSGNAIKITGDGVDVTYNSNKVVEVTGESRLNEFVRLSKTIDDYRNPLPGKKIDDSGALATIYALGSIKNIVSNKDENGGKYYTGDYLYSITVDGDIFTEETGFTQYIASLNEGDSGEISFTYYVGCDLVETGNGTFIVDANYNLKSMKYTDTYNYEVKKVATKISGEDVEFLYADIDYGTGSEYVMLQNLDNLEYLTKLSEIEYNTSENLDGVFNKSPDFVNAPFFMEDYKLGLTYIEKNEETIVIDRGNAAAFERHLRLSEVKTVQDLDNYGNGFFEMKK